MLGESHIFSRNLYNWLVVVSEKSDFVLNFVTIPLLKKHIESFLRDQSVIFVGQELPNELITYSMPYVSNSAAMDFLRSLNDNVPMVAFERQFRSVCQCMVNAIIIDSLRAPLDMLALSSTFYS